MRSPALSLAVPLVFALVVGCALPPRMAGVPTDGTPPMVREQAEASAAGPRSVTLEAGPHTGYRFGASGNVTAKRSIVLASKASAHGTRHAQVAGRGAHIRLTDGVLAGWYVKESIVAYVDGKVASKTFEPVRAVSFATGMTIGYRFDADWHLTDATIETLTAPASAAADRFAVINGRGYYRIVDGAWAGTWVPKGGSFATKPLACRTGQRADDARRIVRTVAGAGREVALTFDMGGRLEPAMRIMRYLLIHGVCTTIFPTGASSQTGIGSQVLAMVRAYPEVFEVGNHTMNHCNLVKGGEGVACPTQRPSSERMRQELRDAAAIIEAATGQSPHPYWRPPYGAYDNGVLDVVAGIGYTTTAMWGIDTIDWRQPRFGGPTAPQISGKVVGGAVNGTVVLMHLGGWKTRAALPAMIRGLRSQRDLVPTSISDLLDLR